MGKNKKIHQVFAEIVYLAAYILLRLAANLYKDRGCNIRFAQSKGILVLYNGRPADRAGWVYLPFLKRYSARFQPPHSGGKNLYEMRLKDGDKIEVKKDGKSIPLTVASGSRGRLEDTEGIIVEGEIKLTDMDEETK